MRAAYAMAVIALAACGGGQRGRDRSSAPFDCRDRWVSYIVAGSLAGSEVGVAMDCAQRGPRLRRWVVAKDGSRDDRGRSLTAGEFDDIWNRIEGAGWRFLKDCDASAAPTDPVYTFDVKDWNGKVSFSCAGRGALPFPYGSIVDELDQAAAAVRGPPDRTDPDDVE